MRSWLARLGKVDSSGRLLVSLIAGGVVLASCAPQGPAPQASAPGVFVLRSTAWITGRSGVLSSDLFDEANFSFASGALIGVVDRLGARAGKIDACSERDGACARRNGSVDS